MYYFVFVCLWLFRVLHVVLAASCRLSLACLSIHLSAFSRPTCQQTHIIPSDPQLSWLLTVMQ